MKTDRNGVPLLKALNFILTHPLNRTQKTKAVLRFFRWQIGSRLVPGEIIYPWLENTKFIVRTGEHGLTQNIYCGLHEFHEMAYLLHVLNADELFIDVGANAGSYTLLASGVKKARAHCFEPVPETFSRLVKNLKINDLTERAQAHLLGIAAQEGELSFTSDQDTGNHILMDGDAGKQSLKVRVTSLDAFLPHADPALIKIDVEGYETPVIEGALQTLQKDSLHSVILELNGSGARYGFREDKIIQTMQSLGFAPYAYDPFTRQLHINAESNPYSGNIIFCKNVPQVNRYLQHAPHFRVNSVEF